MPKPTADDILCQIPLDSIKANIAAARIMRLIDAWEAEMRAEQESVWHSFHRAWTGCVGTPGYDKAPWRECSKQVGGVVGPMGHVAVTDRTLPDAVSVPDDVEQFNREQRIRREAYATALTELGYIAMGSPRDRAATRYPLKKRVAKVIADPHYAHWGWRHAPPSPGEVPYVHAEFYDGSDKGWQRHPSLLLSEERIRLLAELIDNPWTWEDSTEIEDVEPT